MTHRKHFRIIKGMESNWIKLTGSKIGNHITYGIKDMEPNLWNNRHGTKRKERKTRSINTAWRSWSIFRSRWHITSDVAHRSLYLIFMLSCQWKMRPVISSWSCYQLEKCFTLQTYIHKYVKCSQIWDGIHFFRIVFRRNSFFKDNRIFSIKLPEITVGWTNKRESA